MKDIKRKWADQKALPYTQGTAIYTEEENKERARQRARLYYSLNYERNDKENEYDIMQ